MATNNTNRVTQFGQLLQLVSGAADFARNVPHRWYSFDCGAPFGERGDLTHDLFDWFCFFRRGRCLRYRFLLNGFCNNSKGPGSLEETAQNYMTLPANFQRIDADQKQTATAMKACIKEYNATLPTPVKTSGSRDALLEQLAIINPDMVAQEAQKPQPLKVSGTKADLIQAVKAVKPDAVFADELLDAWRDNPEGKVLVTRQQLSTALNIQKALLAHPTAGMLLTHPSRAVEVSYFGFDEETGLEVRVRPDLEIDLDGVRIGSDLKTISMWNVKQESLRARLHREIIERDYHLSAAMYCETAALDQFFWIFVNKDENYHWIAIIEASAELLELGMLEYRKAMRAIATGFDTGEWPAPITADYTDELNDFDQRRLEALRTQA